MVTEDVDVTETELLPVLLPEPDTDSVTDCDTEGGDVTDTVALCEEEIDDDGLGDGVGN
jgi:hypothetical protein